jgi:hypothetical protein
MLEVLGIRNVQKILPLKDEFKPKDPVSENMDVITMKPVKAFSFQDHEAHIRVHMAAMQDPKIQMLIGQSPQAQNMQSSMMAHMNEHIAFQYRIEIEKMLGAPLPPEDEQLPPEIEVALSRAVAAAAEKLLQKDSAEAQQMKNQQQMQDPLLMIQMRELDLKEKEFQHKQTMDNEKLAMDRQEQGLKDARENKRIDTQAGVAGANIGAKKADNAAKIANQQLLKGVELGLSRVPAQGTQKPTSRPS